jgi:hypothetical protein
MDALIETIVEKCGTKREWAIFINNVRPDKPVTALRSAFSLPNAKIFSSPPRRKKSANTTRAIQLQGESADKNWFAVWMDLQTDIPSAGQVERWDLDEKINFFTYHHAAF